MYYFVEFDPKAGVGRKQITGAYEEFARHFEKKFPQFKLVGLYSRNMLLGSRPHYLAIWEFSEYSDLDEWNRAFTKDKEGQQLARVLTDLTTDWEAKIMSKLV